MSGDHNQYQRDKNNVSYMSASTKQPKEVIRITRDGVWINPDVTPDEAAKVVLKALDEQIKTLVQRARADDEAMLRQEPIAWGMPRPDGLILDVICPEEHARMPGEYTIPLYTAPQAHNIGETK